MVSSDDDEEEGAPTERDTKAAWRTEVVGCVAGGEFGDEDMLLDVVVVVAVEKVGEEREAAAGDEAGTNETPFGPKLIRMPSLSNSLSNLLSVLHIRTDLKRLGSGV